MTLITPQIGSFYKPPAPVSSGYSFNMTAGSYFETVFGYVRDTFQIGTIDQEPISGHTLKFCDTNTSSDENTLVFEGDCVSLLTGLSLYVDGVFQYDLNPVIDSGNTTSSVSPVVFTFVDATTYFVELK